MTSNRGRPTAYTEKLRTSLLRILPTIADGQVTKAEAARELGISRRSLRRYAERLEHERRRWIVVECQDWGLG